MVRQGTHYRDARRHGVPAQRPRIQKPRQVRAQHPSLFVSHVVSFFRLDIPGTNCVPPFALDNVQVSQRARARRGGDVAAHVRVAARRDFELEVRVGRGRANQEERGEETTHGVWGFDGCRSTRVDPRGGGLCGRWGRSAERGERRHDQMT